MALSSYDQLLSQVNSLKAENSHLKKELQDNTCHLSKLESEASCMKDALTHIQTAMQEEEATSATITTPTGLDHNSNNGFSPITSPLFPNAARTNKSHSPPSMHSSSSSLLHETSTCPAPIRQLQDTIIRLQELERERHALLAEQDNDDKLKTWYFTQLQSLKQHIDQLPITENYSLQTDMARRQLEYEARQLREVMQQRLGAPDDIGERHEARMQRLCLIEREMQRLQQRRERLERDHQENSVNSDSKDCHNSSMQDLNAVTTRCSSSLPKPHQTPDTKTKDLKHVLNHLPNGINQSIVAGSVNSTEADSPYAHLSADGTVQHIVNNDGQNNSGPAIPPTMLHGTWPYVGGAMAIHQRHVVRNTNNAVSSSSEQETSSVMSFSSSACSSGANRRLQPGQLGAKVEMVYSLLSMLGTHDKDDMSRTLLAMSSSQDSCTAMRQSGCLPLLIQLLHGPDKDSLLGDTRGSKEARARAAASLHNIVHSHPEERCRKQEARVLRLLEQIRAYCDSLREAEGDEGSKASEVDNNPGPAMAALMKLSFDEEHRTAICQLGGLHAIADLLQVDYMYESNGNTSDQYAITIRRYAGMALTNLTFGDAANKALLCSIKGCMQSLVLQLASENEDLRQVAASVIRNLSWRADLASKKILREVGAVAGLMKCALEVKKESTLKSVLSALWNLSAHFTENKADICAVEGALEFLVSTLTYKSPSRTWAVVENGGGILRNVSSHVASNEVYRQVLRDHNCMQLLLRHLKSSSLTIVSNACGTLWNLSARNKYDQDLLWELGAVSMLKNLVHSKHKMIAMGSSAALRNLMSARPDLLNTNENHKEGQPTLHVRKQRALEAEIDKNLRETYMSMEKECHAMQRRMPVRSQHRSPQTSADYSPVPQHMGLWNPQQSPNHELILQQHRERSQSPSSRQLNPRDGGFGQSSYPKELEPRKLVGRSSTADMEQDRVDEGSQHTSAARPIDGTYKRQTGNSRIAQVMQEVSMHAGINATTRQDSHRYLEQPPQDDVEREAPSNTDLPQGDRCEMNNRPNSYNRFGFGGYHTNARRASTESINSINSDIYPMGTHTKLPYTKEQIDHSHSMDGTLNNALDQHQRQKAIFQRVSHEDMGANMDSTINFSLKYSDESLTPSTRPVHKEDQFSSIKPPLDCVTFKPNLGEKQILDSCSQLSNDNQPQPVVLCQECNTPHMQREGMAVGHTFVPPPQVDMVPGNYPSNYSDPAAIQRKVILMTNPSGLDLGGEMDDEKPVDYSRHNLPHSGHLRSRFNEDDNEHYASDQPTDFTQRYNTDLPDSPTEGINFVQTSLTTGTTGNVFMNASEKSDNAFSNALRDSGAEGQLDLLRSDSVDTSTSLSSTQTTISRAHDDKQQMYCVEDTPMVFSRCSSLSSLDSNEAGTHADCQETNVDQASQDFNDCPDESEQVEQNEDAVREVSHQDHQNELTTHELVESGLQTPASLNQIQDTPLIFSRCSSVSSLSSFEVQSICDDHSSCYSDSRRASEVVSPSDLPDSPSQTMPPSPRHSRKELPTQTSSCDPETVGVLPESEENLVAYATEGTPANFSCTTSLSGLTIDDDEKAIATRRIEGDDSQGNLQAKDKHKLRRSTEVESVEISEREQNMLDECINSAMPPKKSTLSNNTSKLRSRNVVNVPPLKSPQQSSKHVSFSQQVCSQEAPNPYATEDTPINFSTATSLSDLSIEDIDIQATGEGELKVNNPLSGSESSPNSQDNQTRQLCKASAVPGEMKSESSSVINDAEDSMLEECINSAMPRPRINKPKSSQLAKHHSPKGLSKLKSPKPSGLPRKRLPSAGARHKSPSPIPEMGSEYQNAASSQERVQQWQNRFGGACDSVRTFCTEGTPRHFSTATSLSGLSIESHSQEDVLNGNVTNPKLQDGESVQLKHRQVDSDASHIDSPSQYLVEGTPMSFSRNDSLSSLSCDDDVDFSKEKKALKAEDTRQKSRTATPPRNKQLTVSKLPRPSSKIAKFGKQSEKPTGIRNKQSNFEANPMRRRLPSQVKSGTSSPLDSPQVFTLEGTPMSFSRNDSLSSLSCEEDADLHNDKARLKKFQRSKIKSSVQGDADSAHKQKPVNKLEHSRFGPPGIKAKQHTSSAQESHLQRPNSAEIPVKFAVEDTPVCFSRNSSLSSLSDHELEEGQHESKRPGPEPTHTNVFAVEDTPICFSRNSSLSSLSVESLDGETSACEQALLDECISSGMPRSQGKKVNRRHHRERKQKPEENDNAVKQVSDLNSPDNELQTLQSPSEDATSEYSEAPEELPEEDKPQRGPRITKPGESRLNSQPELVEKGIRGGRKTYKSPISSVSRSVTVPKSIQPIRNDASKSKVQKVPQIGNTVPKTNASGIRSTAPNKSGSNLTSRSSTPDRKSEKKPSGKPPPINTDTFTKKKNLMPGSAAAKSVKSQAKPTSSTVTATKSLANKQASSKLSTQGTKPSQPGKDASRGTTGKSSLSSQRSTPNTSRNTSPCSPVSRSPRGSISSPSGQGTVQTKSSSLSPARSPMSSRTSSPSPHPTAATRKPSTGLTKGTTPGRGLAVNASTSSKTGTAKSTSAGRGSGVSTSTSPKPGLHNRNLSPRSSVSGSSQRSTSPRNSVTGSGSKNTSPRSSVSEVSARSVSPRNSVSGIQARSVSPKSKTTLKAATQKTSGSPAQGDRANNTRTKVPKSTPRSSNVYRLDVNSSRPTLVKQSTFTKESASLPEQTPENTTGVESEPEKAIEEADENEDSIDNVFSPDDDETEPAPAATASSWRRASASQQSIGDEVEKETPSPKLKYSVNGTKTPPPTHKLPQSTVKPACKVDQNAAEDSTKNSPGSVSKVKREQSAAKPTWNGSVSAPRNWGSNNKTRSRSNSPATSTSKSQGSVDSMSSQKVESQDMQSDNLDNTSSSPKPSGEKVRDLCKELDIPVKNSGGNVTSPTSDSSDDTIWIKREEIKVASIESKVRANTHSRQNSSTASLQSQTSHTGSSRSTKSSNSAISSSNCSTSKILNQEHSELGSHPAVANKQAKDVVEKKKEKKKFSFLKLKMKGKKTESDEKKQKVKESKKGKIKEKDINKNRSEMSPESDMTSSGNDLEAVNLDRHLDQFEMWNSDDNIDNEIMPDEFIEWDDSENDIFKEELPDEYLFESSSDVTSSLTSPDSPCKGAYKIEKGNRTDDSPSPEFKQFRLENRLNSFIRMDCTEKECDADSTHSAPVIGEAKNCRSQSVSDAYPVHSSGEQSPPRPQRLCLPKKPFGINRSDSSPTTAIPVLVSPFNYSPSKRSQSEPHSPDTAHHRFQTQHSYSFQESREHRQRYQQYKHQQRQQAPQEEVVCSSEDSDLISPTLSSRVTTV